MPLLLDEEGAGVVEKVWRGVIKVKSGEHVVTTFNCCGVCPSCNEHKIAYCHEFFPHNFLATRADAIVALTKGAEMVHSNLECPN